MRKTFDQWMDEINKSLKIDMTFHDKYGDDYTFYGIFTIKEIWEKLQYKWKEETMESYLKKYVKYIGTFCSLGYSRSLTFKTYKITTTRTTPTI